jgi:hypothetical protein
VIAVYQPAIKDKSDQIHNLINDVLAKRKRTKGWYA